MVNKVDGNNYYVYETPKKMNVSNTGEKFSLGYEKDGLQAESKEKNGVSGQEKQHAAEQSGVRIELSSQGVEKQRQAEAAEHPKESGLTSLLETIRTFLTAATAAVKDIFDKIWNNPMSDDPLKDNSGLAETAEPAAVIRVTEITETTGFTEAMEDTAASRTEAENTDREIRKHLQNSDIEQVIRLLTDNGRKTAARNSTLLTFYDKNGKVVKLDASVKQRALYGDRNTQKL